MLTERYIHNPCLLRRLALACALSVAFLLPLPAEAAGTEQASYGQPASMFRIRQTSGSVGRVQSLQTADAGRSATPARSSRSARSARAPRSSAVKAQTGLHGAPWAFSDGPSSKAWRNEGVDGMQLWERALRHSRKTAPATAEAQDQKNANRRSARQQGRSEDGIRLSIDRQSQEWRQDDRALHDVDEKVSMDSHHRVRALAGVKEDDLTIGLGPQFIVKDSSQVREHVGRSDDPDVDAGIGMQFQLDF